MRQTRSQWRDDTTANGGPPITAIVVTYRSANCILTALDALSRARDAGLLDCIVVDNGGDDTPRLVRERHPWVRIIESGANIGYGRACNLGLSRAIAPYVFFMNPDVLIEPRAIRTLLDFLEATPSAAMAGPALVDANGHIQEAGFLETPWTLLRRMLGLNPAPGRIITADGGDGRGIARAVGDVSIAPGSPPFETTWLCGAALLARRASLQRIGGFDPRFFLYYEETDLCRRLRANGESLWAVGRATATHEVAASARGENESMYGSCIAQHYFQSRYYYLRKHHGALAATAAELAELSILGVRAIAAFCCGRRHEGWRKRIRAPILQCPPEAGEDAVARVARADPVHQLP